MSLRDSRVSSCRGADGEEHDQCRVLRAAQGPLILSTGSRGVAMRTEFEPLSEAKRRAMLEKRCREPP